MKSIMEALAELAKKTSAVTVARMPTVHRHKEGKHYKGRMQVAKDAFGKRKAAQMMTKASRRINRGTLVTRKSTSHDRQVRRMV